MASVPGIEAASLAGYHPLDAGFTNSFTIVGREAEGRNWPEIALRRVSPSYFRTMKVPIVAGRLFNDGDTALSPWSSSSTKRRRLASSAAGHPIGQQIRFWGTPRLVVGVVGNERFHGLAEAAPPAIYSPLAQTPSPSEALLVRSRTGRHGERR